ncbi:hypothetical protein Tco_0116147 [Tanacetum coccineum]
MDEEETNKEEEANELYRDMNVNLEERDTEMTDALLANVQTTQVIEDTHVIITVATPEVQQQNVPVTSNVEMPPLFVTTLPPSPISLFQPQVKALEDDFLEFKQTNQFATTVSLILGIVDSYLANKMNEAIKTAVQLQLDRLIEKAQAENEDFINTLDENMRKIIKKQIKEQVKEKVSKILLKIKKFINDQLEAEVLTRLSNQAKTSHAKTLYKALVDAYETEKDILETYGDTVTARKEPDSTSAPKEKPSKSTDKYKEGSKSHHTSTGKSAQVEELIHADEDLEEPAHQEFDIGFTEDQPVDENTQHPDCTLVRNEDPRKSFNELMDTPLDFSAFVTNWLKVDTPTSELLAGLTYKLMKGKLTNLNVEERLALGVSLRMFTRSIVLRRRVEDL